MKPISLLLAMVCLAAATGCCAENAVDDLLKSAKTAAAARRFDEALGCYERVIEEHPEALSRWFEAQQGIAAALAAKGDFPAAAKAVHLAVDCAPGVPAFDAATTAAANILSALDQNVERANRLLAFQQTGPVNGAGNPLDAVGYPSAPEREKAFAQLRAQAGDSAAGSRLRAYTFLLTGKPREALACFADAFRRSSTVRDAQLAGSDLIAPGLRAVAGHRLGQENAVQYLKFGPHGTDGIAHTGDDIADPFDGLLPAAPPVGEGGLAGVEPAGLAALRHVRDAAWLYAGDSSLRAETRRCGLMAMQRANEALDGWGDEGQKDEFLQIAFASGDVAEAALACAEAAAKGRALHFGGIGALLREIDACQTAHGLEPAKAFKDLRGPFDSALSAWDRLSAPPPKERALKKPATF